MRLVLPLLLVLFVVSACGTPGRRVRTLPGDDAPASTTWDQGEFDDASGKPVPAGAAPTAGKTGKGPRKLAPPPVVEPELIDGDPWGELDALTDGRYVGPRVEAEIVTRPGQADLYSAFITVMVPTGGYELSFGGARVEGPNMTLMVKLKAPGKDEIRSMAFEHLTLRHGAGTQRIGQLKVYVNVLARGEKATGYRLAKSIP